MSYSTRVELRNCRRTLFTIFWLGISYRGDPNRKQSILAQKSQQVIFTMIFYQNSNAVCSKVNKVRQQFLSSTRVEYDMKDTFFSPCSVKLRELSFAQFVDFFGESVFIFQFLNDKIMCFFDIHAWNLLTKILKNDLVLLSLYIFWGKWFII